MDLSTFIVAVFCLIDDRLEGLGRLRARGDPPRRSSTRRSSPSRSSASSWGSTRTRSSSRTSAGTTPTSSRASGGCIAHHLRQAGGEPVGGQGAPLAGTLGRDPPRRSRLRPGGLLPPAGVPVFARAYRCRRFKGEAAFGKDTLIRQTFYGFRVHMRVCWPGLITRISVAPANAHELSVLPEIAEGTSGVLVGDRNYHIRPRRRRNWRGWA